MRVEKKMKNTNKNLESTEQEINKILSENKEINVSRRNINFKVRFDKYFNFWLRYSNDNWEPETFNVFDKFINEDTFYIDIGSWIGPTLLYAAQLAKKSIGFEPSKAYKSLKENISLNYSKKSISNIELFNTAVGLSDDEILLGGASPGNSGDSIFVSENSVLVKQTNIIKYLKENTNEKDELFIKIDTEGAEYSFFNALYTNTSHTRCIYYLSTHPQIIFRKYKAESNLISASIKAFFKQYLLLKKAKKLYDNNFNTIRFRFFYVFKTIKEKNRSFIIKN